jgi:hypothetical protein
MRMRATLIAGVAIGLVLVSPSGAWAKRKPPHGDAYAIRACTTGNQLAAVVLLGNANLQDAPYTSVYSTVESQFARSHTKGAHQIAKVMADSTGGQLAQEAAIAKAYGYCNSIGRGDIHLPPTS